MSLPLFLDLTDRLVVAVGGGPVSARRARGFVDEGAHVRVIAPWLCEDLIDLFHAEQVEWEARDYAGAGDLVGAWLVHTATGDSDIDRAVAHDADTARLWCIDATAAGTTPASVPARSTVQTPDGVVTVATHVGGDPRTAVAASQTAAQVIDDALSDGRIPWQRNRAREAGWVALVGGGPGDDGLLTRRAHELIASADVLVVDRLAPTGIVSRLPESVRVINVGKTAGHHPIPQERINELLAEEANRGHGVVRLKGGDPYVLGRGGEERIFCEQRGIHVEVIPGVTSAISVPAAAGIPVTHRGVARGFSVVTGHDEVPALPTSGDHTLILLMGVAGLRRSADLLLAHGRDPECPVAIVERGFDPTQRTTIGPLKTIADLATAQDVQAPAVVIVGDVVRLADAWPTSPGSAAH